MEISKKNLLEALEVVKPGLASREMIEQSTSFAFMGDRIVTYNDQISISHPVSGLELTGAINAEKLYSLLSKWKDDKLTMEVGEAEIILRNGRAKAGLSLQSEIKLPLDEETAYKEKWKQLPEGFLMAVDFSVGACSTNTNRIKLTCVHVSQKGYAEGSDSFRIMRVQMKDEMPIEDFLLPAKAATVMLKMQPTKIAKGRGWIHFKNNAGTILSCRIIEESYPASADDLFKFKGMKITFPQSTEEILDKAIVFAKREHLTDEIVEISISENRIKIRGEADSGWFEEMTRMAYEEEPVQFYITPYLLKGIIKRTLDATLSDDKILFSGDGWAYVSLLKVKKTNE